MGGSFPVVDASNANGAVLVSGQGSEISLSGALTDVQIGRDGIGSMTIEQGGLLQGALFTTLGRFSGGSGVLLIDGTNDPAGTRSTYALSGAQIGTDFGAFMNIGLEGFGSVTVQDGGLLSIDGETGIGPGMNIGRNAGSVGMLTIEGVGSELIITGNEAFVSIGRTGAGMLTLSGGASATIGSDAFVEVGRDAGGVGTLAVLSGSQFIMQGGNDFSQLVLGRFAGSEGTAIVQGPGSRIASLDIVENRLEIGREGTGSLSILDGGLVDGFDNVFVGREGTATGTLLISGFDEGTQTRSEINVIDSINFGQDFDNNSFEAILGGS
ncbi:MAG: hypothetical protein R3245_12675, partial [Kiloniellales bacterium]|nr:hypothetical protein [Kiloniellales bacterium]